MYKRTGYILQWELKSWKLDRGFTRLGERIAQAGVSSKMSQTTSVLLSNAAFCQYITFSAAAFILSLIL